MVIIIAEEQLNDTFPYLDDITVGFFSGGTDSNVAAFLMVLSKRNVTLNKSKSILSFATSNVLGYLIGSGVVRPERLRPLQALPPPTMFDHNVEC